MNYGMNMDYLVLIEILLLVSLLLVSFDAICTIIENRKEYNKSSFKYLTHVGFWKAMLNRTERNKYNLFAALEKNCQTGHLLADVVIKDLKDEEVHYDLVMIDKFGISIFEIEDEWGTITGNANMPFWKLKKIFGTYKIPNYSMVSNRKLEVMKDKLKIYSSDVINSYLVFDERCKFKKLRIDNKELKIVKRPYVNGMLAYEINTAGRVLSDSEINAYTIMLEKFTSIPVYVRNQRIDDSISEFEDDVFNFEFTRQLSNYKDLKSLWRLLLKCDKEVFPPFSLRRKDLDDIPPKARHMLLPNIFFKHIIQYPMVLVKYKGEVVGFLSLETGRVLRITEDLGRVNFINSACIAREFRKEGLLKDLIRYVETMLPEELVLPYIICKTTENNTMLNKQLKLLGYREKVVVDTREEYGANTVYYFKLVKRKYS